MEYRLEAMETRLEHAERRLLQVENAFRGLVATMESPLIAGPCGDCERSLLLVSEGHMYCPQCGYRRIVG